jgi:hypothetical protein
MFALLPIVPPIIAGKKVVVMLYPEKETPVLTPELFRSPGPEYRAAPFWAWNCALRQETLNRQIDCMKEMGFGGFHMHVRVGLETEYLSDPYMALIRGCVEKAKETDMLAWLYDEDKWPSGFAGGLVTKDPTLREKFLLFTLRPYGEGTVQTVDDSSARADRAENGTLLGRYAVTLDDAGCLAAYRRLAEGETAPEGAALRYAYLETQTPSAWFNLQSYVDTLSPAAMRKFIEVTHEQYLSAVGADFGGTVPAIFTDEPQFARKQTLADPFLPQDVILPWTTDFCRTYQETFGEDILDFLPELFWELPAGVSAARWRYHDHVAERFASAFADTVGQWCGEHNIMLTGHMMEEDNLHSQTAALGDCMRSYRSFQLPGIDMLCDGRNLNTAKQAQSACHQYARPGVLSELYGVTNWDFPFRRHKLQGDWQAALGVSVRVPHLYWVSMRGEAKRDYPASIGHQSPWYREYAYLEDHFARISSAMTRGNPVVRIGVVHPVESYWLHWGPNAQTKAVRDELDERFSQLTDWLLFHQLDFDFICESLLPGQFDPDGEGFAVGAMRYDVVIVPNLETIRSATLAALRQFRAKGGTVLFAGNLPDCVDAEATRDALDFALETPKSLCPWSRVELLRALEPWREISLTKNGVPVHNVISQLRQDGDARWLFLCHVFDEKKYFVTDARQYEIRLRGAWSAETYDTLTGEISSCPARIVRGWTVLPWRAYPQDSLLLKCTPAAEDSPLPSGGRKSKALPGNRRTPLPGKLPVTLQEPNVLVLDQPRWSLDGGDWQPEEEILRIGDRCKKMLGFENEIARGCQPWVLRGDPAARPSHSLRLRYVISSAVSAAPVTLAAEDLETLRITWNGAEIPARAAGWYVDEAIQTVVLGPLRGGENLLELEIPFGKITPTEVCYLLGDFGAEVRGRFASVIAPVRELAFGDWTGQGLPFYGGSVTYHAVIQGAGSPLALEVPHFTLPVLGVDLDGARRGVIAISPWRCDLGSPPAGDHALDIVAFGNRLNTFGMLHNANFTETWVGPNCWREHGCHWTYEYRLTPSGILVAPEIQG